jgi:hypothetical protein
MTPAAPCLILAVLLLACPVYAYEAAMLWWWVR